MLFRSTGETSRAIGAAHDQLALVAGATRLAGEWGISERMIGMTIQALEVQRMTLDTLKGMKVPMDALRESLKARMPTASYPAPQAAPLNHQHAERHHHEQHDRPRNETDGLGPRNREALAQRQCGADHLAAQVDATGIDGQLADGLGGCTRQSIDTRAGLRRRAPQVPTRVKPRRSYRRTATSFSGTTPSATRP